MNMLEFLTKEEDFKLLHANALDAAINKKIRSFKLHIDPVGKRVEYVDLDGFTHVAYKAEDLQQFLDTGEAMVVTRKKKAPLLAPVMQDESPVAIPCKKAYRVDLAGVGLGKGSATGRLPTKPSLLQDIREIVERETGKQVVDIDYTEVEGRVLVTLQESVKEGVKVEKKNG